MGDKEQQAEQTQQEQAEQAAQPKPDKPVEQSQFNKYRDAYLRQELARMNVKDAEMDAAISFIDERADDTDSNLDDVFRQLKVRMRLDERQKYVDPSPMNGPKVKPQYVDRGEIGKQTFERLKKMRRI